MEGCREECTESPEEGPHQDGMPRDPEVEARALVHEHTAVEEQDGEFGGCDENAVGELDSIHQLDVMNDVGDRVEYGVSS